MKRTKEEAVDFGLPYDYNSVMHYRYAAFARKKGSATLVPKHKEATKTMGQRTRMSTVDFAKLNRLYNCSSKYYRGEDLLGQKFIFGKVEKPKVKLDEEVFEEIGGEDSEEIKQVSYYVEKKPQNESIKNSTWWTNLWSKVALLDEDKTNPSANSEVNSSVLKQQKSPIEGLLLVTRTKRQTSNTGSRKSEPMQPGNSDSFAPQKILPELLKGVLNSDNDRPIVIQFAIYQPIVYKSANESDSNNEGNKFNENNSDKKNSKKDREQEEKVETEIRDINSSTNTEEQFNNEKQSSFEGFHNEEQQNLQTHEEKNRYLQNSEQYYSQPKYVPKPLELPDISDERVSVDRREYTLPSQLSFHEDERYSVTQTDYKITPKTHPQDQSRQEYQKGSPQIKAQKEIDTYYATRSYSPTYSEVKSSPTQSRDFGDDSIHYNKPFNKPSGLDDRFTNFQSTHPVPEPNGDSEISSKEYQTKHAYEALDERNRKVEDDNFHSISRLHSFSDSELDNREIKEEVHSRDNHEEYTDHFEETISEDNYSNQDSENNQKVREEPQLPNFQTERSITEVKGPAISNDGRISSSVELTDRNNDKRVSEPKINPRNDPRNYDKKDVPELDNDRPKYVEESENQFGIPSNKRNAKPPSQKSNEKIIKELLSLKSSRNTGTIHENDKLEPFTTQQFGRESQMQPKHDLFIEDDFTDELDKEIRKKKVEQTERIHKTEEIQTNSRKMEEKMQPNISVSVERRSQTNPKVIRKVSSRNGKSVDEKNFDNEGLIVKPKAAKLNLDPRQALPLQVSGSSNKNATTTK